MYVYICMYVYIYMVHSSSIKMYLFCIKQKCVTNIFRQKVYFDLTNSVVRFYDSNTHTVPNACGRLFRCSNSIK